MKVLEEGLKFGNGIICWFVVEVKWSFSVISNGNMWKLIGFEEGVKVFVNGFWIRWFVVS